MEWSDNSCSPLPPVGEVLVIDGLRVVALINAVLLDESLFAQCEFIVTPVVPRLLAPLVAIVLLFGLTPSLLLGLTPVLFLLLLAPGGVLAPSLLLFGLAPFLFLLLLAPKL